MNNEAMRKEKEKKRMEVHEIWGIISEIFLIQVYISSTSINASIEAVISNDFLVSKKFAIQSNKWLNNGFEWKKRCSASELKQANRKWKTNGLIIPLLGKRTKSRSSHLKCFKHLDEFRMLYCITEIKQSKVIKSN